MVSLTTLRSYRLDLEHYPFFNNKNIGIALFDLVLSFIGAYLLGKLFDLPKYLNCNKELYYYLVIPFGILIHYIISSYISNSIFNPTQITFLNKKLFSFEVNIYKILILLLLYKIYTLYQKC